MKNGATYFKYGSLLVIVIIVVWFFNNFKCGRGGGSSKTTTDTIKIIRDTVIHRVDTLISYVPRPYKIVEHDTLEIDGEPIVKWKEIPASVMNAYKDYYSKKYYRDSFDIKFGKLYLEDTVYKNSLTGRSFRLVQSIPEITNTIIMDKHRTKLYLGLSVAGNVKEPLSYVGADVSLLMKNQSIVGIQGGVLKGGNTIYGLSYRKLITFRKK